MPRATRRLGAGGAALGPTQGMCGATVCIGKIRAEVVQLGNAELAEGLNPRLAVLIDEDLQCRCCGPGHCCAEQCGRSEGWWSR